MQGLPGMSVESLIRGTVILMAKKGVESMTSKQKGLTNCIKAVG